MAGFAPDVCVDRTMRTCPRTCCLFSCAGGAAAEDGTGAPPSEQESGRSSWVLSQTPSSPGLLFSVVRMWDRKGDGRASRGTPSAGRAVAGCSARAQAGLPQPGLAASGVMGLSGVGLGITGPHLGQHLDIVGHFSSITPACSLGAHAVGVFF